MLLVDILKEDKERADVWNNTASSSLPVHLPHHEKQSTGWRHGKTFQIHLSCEGTKPRKHLDSDGCSELWWGFWLRITTS